MVIDPKLEERGHPQAPAALQAARSPAELTWRRSVVGPRHREALYRTGDAEGAVATEEKALKRLEPEVKDRSVGLYKVLTERLERYRKAASEKTDRR